MSIVSATGTQTAASAAKQTSLKTNMDYDSFLKLFMAQMKNQDPTKPSDPTATLSQLASFSNVEQSIKANGKLEALLTVSNATLASSLLGRTLTSLDGSVSGVASDVVVGSDGLTATLSNGKTLDLSSGYRIGAK